jgi:hypothetical protein
MTNLTDPIFHDEDKAREHLEAMRWPNGPWCPHCGSENVKRLEGKSYTPGALYCRDCRKKFTVAVGTLSSVRTSRSTSGFWRSISWPRRRKACRHTSCTACST